MKKNSPVEESASDQRRPCHPRIFLAPKIFHNLNFPSTHRRRHHILRLRRIATKLARDKFLHAGLDRGVDDFLLFGHLVRLDQADDHILACERGQQLVFGVFIAHTVGFDRAFECGFGGLAGEDGDGESGIIVEGSKNIAAEIPPGLLGY